MPQPRVFVPQIVRKRDPLTHKFEPIHDLSHALSFGQIVTILDPEDDPRMLSRHTQKIKKALSDFTHEDYLVAVGDPALLIACGAYLSRLTTINVLKWMKSTSTYINAEVKL